jgi:hypothetical protein
LWLNTEASLDILIVAENCAYDFNAIKDRWIIYRDALFSSGILITRSRSKFLNHLSKYYSGKIKGE